MKEAKGRFAKIWAALLAVAGAAAVAVVGWIAFGSVDARPSGGSMVLARLTRAAEREVGGSVTNLVEGGAVATRHDAGKSITVSSAQQLERALGDARGGDVLLLSPGDFGDVAIRDVHVDGGVKVASKDPAHPAILTGLKVTNSRGLRLEGLELSTAGQTAPNPFRVTDSQDVHLEGMNIHGDVSGDLTNSINALIIINSSNVSVEHSEFHHVKVALAHRNCDHLTFTGNNFHDIRQDGIHGSGSSWVTITNNQFTDFYREGDPKSGGDHPDAVQFWTATTSTSSHDIVVAGNIMKRGKGKKIQGVFMKQVSGNVPFVNVTIKNNTIIGEAFNGIAINHGNNVTISDNSVQPYSDQMSWIRVEASQDVLVANNSAGRFIFRDVTGLRDQSNKVVGATAP